MAAERTHITELATAAGMVLGDVHWDLDLLAALEIPGIDDDVWRPILEPAAQGFCEIRWSHRKFQGNPECKVQLRTNAADLPGYTPLEQDHILNSGHTNETRQAHSHPPTTQPTAREDARAEPRRGQQRRHPIRLRPEQVRPTSPQRRHDTTANGAREVFGVPERQARCTPRRRKCAGSNAIELERYRAAAV